jgi:preprotein translocase subunit YajC
MMAFVFAVVYFLMIRPQQRRRRQVMEMQSNMGPGDEVVTVGGLYGTIESLDDETVMLEIAPDVVARYARLAISRVVSPAARTGDDDLDDDQSDNADEPVAGKVADPD